ncbi:MAG: hypothetical protein SGI86_16070 [Deltaproteobacteria bacterium]|nr:hypothetical protein [Deltaproteobacteria bacterium]
MKRCFHFLYSGVDGLQYWQNIVIAASTVDEAKTRLLERLVEQNVRFVEIDDEATLSAEIETISEEWKRNARNFGVAIIGIAGRIWIE